MPSNIDELINLKIASNDWDGLANIGTSVVESLITFIKDKNTINRDIALKALVKIKDPRVVDQLIVALNDNDKKVQLVAVSALAHVKDLRVVESLISLLEDQNCPNRERVASVLGSIKDSKAVKPLIMALKDQDDSIRESAAWALGYIKHPMAVEPLIEALKDEDSRVRLRSVIALGEIKDQRRVAPLVEALKDQNRQVLDEAANILKKIGWKPSNIEERISFSLTTHNVGDLEIIGTPAINSLLIALKDSSSGRRKVAVKALGRLCDSRAIEPLIVSLKDQSLDVREEAAEALGKIGDIRAVVPLIASLEEYELQPVALESLVNIGVTAIDPLIAGLNEQSEIIRRSSAEALGKIKDYRAVKPLIAALNDDNCCVRYNAAKALGEIKDPMAIKPLIVALKDDDDSVRWEASASLMEIRWRIAGGLFNFRDPRAVRAVKTFHRDENRKFIYNLIAQKKGNALREDWEITKEVLLNDIESKEYNIIENALFSFMGIGKEEIVPIIIEKLNTKGNKTMAEAYLNCGHSGLIKAAREWAERRGYTIKVGEGAHPVSWGAW